MERNLRLTECSRNILWYVEVVHCAESQYICNSNWFSEEGPNGAHPFAQGFADFSEDSVHGWSAVVNLYFVSDNQPGKGDNLLWSASAKNLLQREKNN